MWKVPRVKDDDVQVEMRVLREEDKRGRHLQRVKIAQVEHQAEEGRLPGWKIKGKVRNHIGLQ